MHPILSFAVQVARTASQQISHQFERLIRQNHPGALPGHLIAAIKEQTAMVTQELIEHSYPEHAIYNGLDTNYPDPLTDDYQWLILPLCGRNNFAQGYPCFAIAIVICVNQKFTHGVIVNVMNREEINVSRGKGAYLNNQRMRVISSSNLSELLLATNLTTMLRQAENIPVLTHLAQASQGLRCSGVPLLDIIDTAAGRLGGYLGVNTEPTQQRVERGLGQLIMQESGGLMADFRANPDCLLAKGVIYANPQLLKTLVKLISPMIS